MPPEIPNLLQKRPDENKRDSSTETDTTTSSESDQEEDETVNKGKKNLTLNFITFLLLLWLPLVQRS